MTLILGSRCSDGVVLVADKIVTNQTDGLNFYFAEKLFSILHNVVIGSSGSSGNFELFRNHIAAYINRNQTKANVNEILLTLSSQTYALNERYRTRHSSAIFDILVGIGHQDKPATLTYLNSFGLLNPEAKYRLIGSGSRYAKTFLERIWNRDMTMAKVAEIGYFVIKYIEELKLDHTVGLDTRGPQIWFIPDHYAKNIAQNERKKDIVRQADNQEMNDFAEHVKKRLDNYNKFIDGLFVDS